MENLGIERPAFSFARPKQVANVERAVLRDLQRLRADEEIRAMMERVFECWMARSRETHVISAEDREGEVLRAAPARPAEGRAGAAQ